ncbi:MAG: leucine-rich repeat domain-containing protein [Bacteroidales bacterium]|nr:leucine-rich repeat domain-containing protein [Bacteroidales bacterium]
MKRTLFLLLAMLFANVLFAQNVDPNAVEPDFEVGYLGYKYKPNNEVAVNNYDRESTTLPMHWNLEIPTTVTHDGTTYTVTSIGTAAFSGCVNLQSVVIPSSVTSIDYNAFTTCNNLQSVVIPSSVTSIGNNAFLACGSLNSITIAEGVETIGSSAFSGCNSLVNITLPNSVNNIGDAAFKDCDNLLTVTIGSGLTAIADHAFNSCMQLKTVNFNGNSLTTIGNHAFYDCEALKKIVLPNSVTIIEDCAFKGCSLLDTIDLPDVLTTIGVEAFCSCSNLKSIDVSNNVTSIGEGAFVSCVLLPTINIPNNPSFNTINKNVFYGCSSLNSITIPDNVTIIGNSAFEGCSSLISVTIPSSVTEIGGSAFYNCSNLTSVVSLRDPAPTLDASIPNLTFGNTHISITLTVPFNAQGYTYNWGNANWQKIYHKINEGEIKPLSNTFEITIANKREVINEGVLVIEQGGELVNQTATNVGGIIEVKTKSLPNNKWSFIGAPFAEYKLETVVPGAHDISVSTFNYGTGAWSDEWSTIETQIGAGEGFFAWSYATEPTIFTNYGDGMYSPNAHSDYSDYNYDFNSTTNPVYQLNNGDVTFTKTLTTNGGNWMALANPYTFKLDIATFLGDQQNVQGGVSYRFNGTQWVATIQGVIDVTEGFFVNFTSAGEHSATFKKSQRYIPTQAKASVEREFVRLAMLEGEIETEVLFAQNEQANEEYDIFDANKLFSPSEITEPYFVVNNIELVKEEVNTLPYYATMNVKSYGNKEVTFKANYIPEGLAVSIIDGEETIDLSEGVEYTTNIIAGENADRFKVLIKKSLSIEEAEELQVNIYNNNRHINIETIENDLQVEVYNALGQKVLSTKDRNFTLNQVSAGAYLIKAFNNKASKTQKILVK